MALPASGAMRMGANVDVELSLASTTAISLGSTSVRGLYGVASGAIRLAADGYGKANLPSFAPFVGGMSAGNTIGYSNNDKYTFSNDSTAVGTVYPISAGGTVAAAGNTTTAIFRVNGTSASRRFYTYSTDSWATGTALSTTASSMGSISNKTVAIDQNASAATTQKYTYSSSVESTGGSLTYNPGYGGSSCIGNSTVGIFCGGGVTGPYNALKTSSIYTYSTDTTATGGNLVIATYSGGAFWAAGIGISTIGYFCGGVDQFTVSGINSTSSYTYSTNATAAGFSLNYPICYSGGGGSPTTGINIGGATNIQSYGAYTANSTKYTYSSTTVSSGGSLSQAKYYLAGPGATPAAI